MTAASSRHHDLSAEDHGTLGKAHQPPDLPESAHIPGQAVGFLLFGLGLHGTTGEVVDFGQTAVGFGFLRTQFHCL